MEPFSKETFEKLDAAGRARLAAELGAELQRRLVAGGEFHQAVRKLVNELRALGHDLWSFDESDEMEAWGPNYQSPTGPGIVVTFTPEGVTVEYSRT